ncbi:MAG TPA: hypothetical protein VN408_40830, partial [Actinoplanes sp.]|nr:hypothetical protein [Actinoplanes sp.]
MAGTFGGGRRDPGSDGCGPELRQVAAGGAVLTAAGLGWTGRQAGQRGSITEQAQWAARLGSTGTGRRTRAGPRLGGRTRQRGRAGDPMSRCAQWRGRAGRGVGRGSGPGGRGRHG